MQHNPSCVRPEHLYAGDCGVKPDRYHAAAKLGSSLLLDVAVAAVAEGGGGELSELPSRACSRLS